MSKPDVVAWITEDRLHLIFDGVLDSSQLIGCSALMAVSDHEAARAADKARIEELETENEEVKGLLNDAVLDVKSLCRVCKSNWLLRHCKDKPHMHEYQAERNELLGLLRDLVEIEHIREATAGPLRDIVRRADATLAKHGEQP